jgi:hypothetical protein
MLEWLKTSGEGGNRQILLEFFAFGEVDSVQSF